MVVKLNHDITQKLYHSAEETLLTPGTKSMHTDIDHYGCECGLVYTYHKM